MHTNQDWAGIAGEDVRSQGSTVLSCWPKEGDRLGSVVRALVATPVKAPSSDLF